MLRPSISIIVPCFNQAKYVSDCITSIINQTFKNWECIIVDDNSPDKPFEVIEPFIGLFVVNNIEIIQNNKVNTTLNQGSPFEISFKVENKTTEITNFEFNIEIKNSEGTAITCFGNEFQKHEISLSPISTNIIRLSIDELLLKTGNYFASFYFKLNNKTEVYDKYIEDIVRLNIESPSPLYFASEKYDWKFFPTRHQHGSVNLKVHKFECVII